MTIDFKKYQGTGNDFIIINQMDSSYDLTESQIAWLCDRRIGVGADGLMYMRPWSDGDFRMVYFNADGSESTMCGNGGRCISAMYYSLYPQKKDRLSFIAIDGPHYATGDAEYISLQMTDVHGVKWSGDQAVLDTGSPHLVKLVDEVRDVDVKSSGAEIRYSDPYALEGINVNFLEINDNDTKVRTYERGVEDETLSCGTGVTACAIAAYQKRNLSGRQTIIVDTEGGRLQVSMDKEAEGFSDIWLKGPATHVFNGEILLPASL